VVINPATGVGIAEIEVTTVNELHEKFENCQAAQQEWQHVSYAEKRVILQRFMAFLAEPRVANDLAATMATETGKPVSQGLGEVDACGYRIQWFLDNVLKAVSTEHPEPEHFPSDSISHEPIGVCAFLSAWNFPTLMTVDYLMPALLCGNGVVIKPSEYASMTACKIKTLLDEAGLPPDLVQLAFLNPF